MLFHYDDELFLFRMWNTSFRLKYQFFNYQYILIKHSLSLCNQIRLGQQQQQQQRQNHNGNNNQKNIIIFCHPALILILLNYSNGPTLSSLRSLDKSQRKKEKKDKTLIIVSKIAFSLPIYTCIFCIFLCSRNQCCDYFEKCISLLKMYFIVENAWV